MTIHEICVTARREADCTRCGARRGRDCDCGPRGVHLARIARAHFRTPTISEADFASVIHDGMAEATTTVVLDPVVAA